MALGDGEREYIAPPNSFSRKMSFILIFGKMKRHIFHTDSIRNFLENVISMAYSEAAMVRTQIRKWLFVRRIVFYNLRFIGRNQSIKRTFVSELISFSLSHLVSVWKYTKKWLECFSGYSVFRTHSLQLIYTKSKKRKHCVDSFMTDKCCRVLTWHLHYSRWHSIETRYHFFLRFRCVLVLEA